MRLRSTFSSAASRLDHLVQDIKLQQYDATGQRQRPLPPPLRETGPQTLQVNPARRMPEHFAPLASFLPAMRTGRPRKPVLVKPLGEAGPDLHSPQAGTAGHIGAGLGKDGPRRGFLNWLFRRDN